MTIFAQDIVFQEVPGETSIALAVCGCPKNCPGCSWKVDGKLPEGFEFTLDDLSRLLDKEDPLVDCVLFLGGEWEADIVSYLELVQDRGLKTCLYTGELSVCSEILNNLNYIKTGPYIVGLGGLDNPNTNQKLINLDTGEDITYKFWQ